MKADIKHTPRTCPRHRERGNSRLNFLIVIAVLGLLAYVAYQVVPVMYNASLYKVYMQDTVNKAVATGKDTAWVKEQLTKNGAEEYKVPADQSIETKLEDGRITARSRWTRPVPLPGYIYNYDFDHTVKSGDKITSSE
jgi:hypothetical protein